MISFDSLYTDELWERFAAKFGKFESEVKVKKYPQLDPYFNFFKHKDEIKKLVSDPTLEKIATHSFLPFVKILTKTPRYRYQENENEYGLETKIRPISFASHFDTYIYGFFAFALNEKYQTYISKNGFSNCVLAYRTDLNGKCNIQFAKDVFSIVRAKIEKENSCTVIALDIKGYFDNIDHKILKEKWCKVLEVENLPMDQFKVFKTITNYSYVNKDSVIKHFQVNLNKIKKEGQKWQSLLDLIPDKLNGPKFNQKLSLLRERKLIIRNLPKQGEDGKMQFKGIPQGSPMSSVLSNIYLMDFDSWLNDLSIKMDFSYQRYCDDLIIICKTEDVTEINAKVLLKIKEYNLEIQSKKTELIEFKKNSQGRIRGFNRKKINELKVKITSTNEQKFYKNLQYLGFEYNGQNIYIRPGSLSRYFKKMKGRIVKTILMAYSKKSKTNHIKKKQIYTKYSHFGSRNFITYAYNAAKETYSNNKKELKEGMNSKSILRQLSSHLSIIEHEIIKTSEVRFAIKERKREKLVSTGKRRKYIPLKL